MFCPGAACVYIYIYTPLPHSVVVAGSLCDYCFRGTGVGPLSLYSRSVS